MESHAQRSKSDQHGDIAGDLADTARKKGRHVGCSVDKALLCLFLIMGGLTDAAGLNGCHPVVWLHRTHM